MEKLSPRQSKFVSEYIIDRNGKQAAIRTGYSPKTAESQASRLLSIAKVKSAVEAAIKAQEERTEITADRILKEIFRIATADLSKAYDVNGNLLPIPDMPEDVRRAIAGIDVDDLFDWDSDEGKKTKVGITSKVRFWDKPRCLEMLGRWLRLFTEKVEISGKDGSPITIKVVSYGGLAPELVHTNGNGHHSNGNGNGNHPAL